MIDNKYNESMIKFNFKNVIPTPAPRNNLGWFYVV